MSQHEQAQRQGNQVLPADLLPGIVDNAAQAAATLSHGGSWMQTSDLLFLAWCAAFLKDWARAEATLNQAAVMIARRLAGDQADRIVFRRPLYFNRDITGKDWQVRDMVYESAPFWYAAYYEIVVMALGEPKP